MDSDDTTASTVTTFFAILVLVFLVTIWVTAATTKAVTNDAWKERLVIQGCGYYNPTNGNFEIGHFPMAHKIRE